MFIIISKLVSVVLNNPSSASKTVETVKKQNFVINQCDAIIPNYVMLFVTITIVKYKD